MKKRAYLCFDDRAGRREEPVEIIGESPKRYRIVAARRIRLAGRGRWLEIGKDALVPKSAVRFEYV